MANERSTGFALSKSADGIDKSEFTADSFKAALKNLSEDELAMYLRSHVRSRVPVAFSTKPLLWEAVRSWLSMHLKIDPHVIGLAGSAQIGFSASPKQFGKVFSKLKSDLDFFIVSDELFKSLISEIRFFCSDARDDHVTKFSKQIETLKRQAARGFFDLKQIPSWDAYAKCARANNLASMIVDKLKYHDFSLEHSFFRVYESWRAFSRQTQVTYLDLKSKLS